MTYRIAIIGAGRVAREHARAIKAIGAELAAVCDTVGEKAHQFIAELHPEGQDDAAPRPQAIESLDHLLSMDDIQAVVVAVPNAMHRDVAVQALRMSKHVLLEKPMALSVAECDDIITARDEADRLVQMAFVCRYAPRVAAVRDLIASGELGRIYHAKATMIRRRGIPGLGRWFTTRAQSGGGVLIDLGVHLIDLVMHLTNQTRAERVSGVCESRFGSPIEAYAYEEMWAGPPDPNGVFDVEDAAYGLIRFDRNVTLELNITWAANVPDNLYRDGILLLGDRGGCFFDLWGDQFIITRERYQRLVDEKPSLDNSNAWNRAWNTQHETFRNSVMNRVAPVASAHAGRSVQQIVEAMYESSASRREVAVSM